MTTSGRLAGGGAWSGARAACVLTATLLALAAIGAQVMRLSTVRRAEPRIALAEPMARTLARPDLVDRHGRLVATDVAAPSLHADPTQVIDLDETVERLAEALPGLEAAELRRVLSDRTRRFAWIRRGLTPIEAQRVHDLGLPGLGFRREPKRVYPNGALVGHVLGRVDVDNRGRQGIERHLDEALALDAVNDAAPSRHAPVRLSIDLGVQQGMAAELAAALASYQAAAAAGLVMDVASGEILAAVSLPAVDPNRPSQALDPARADRLQAGVYELGSIFKAFTVALATEAGLADLDSKVDTVQAIEISRHRIRDHSPALAPLTVREIFLTSSNVGAGRLALLAGADRQRAFLDRMGLTEAMRTEAGPVAPPLLPERWGAIETVTIGYGHGLAVSPVQFAAAAAALVNGGLAVTPTFLARGAAAKPGPRVLASTTSDAQRQLWRLNVTAPNGTGRRADAAGMRVGGKTGTAEMPGAGGYKAKSVIASFVGAFPMEAPRWLVLVSLFEPRGTAETRGAITAAHNAAPVTGRVVSRLAPMLGVLPRRIAAAPALPAAPAIDNELPASHLP